MKDFEHYLVLAYKMSTIVSQFENSVAGEIQGEATKKGGRQAGRQAFVFNRALINQDKKQPRTGGEKQVRERLTLKGRSAGQTITKSPRKR